MSAKPATAEKFGVTLIRQGIGREEFAFPERATLADLLERAQVQAEDNVIFIDGRPLAEHIDLRPGMIVTIVAKSKPALDDRWRETIGMFHGNEAFRELVEAVEASREAEKDRS